MIYYIIVGYFLIINLMGIIIMGIDKKRAIEKKWRISEKNLLIIAVLGGSIGCIIGMNFFRHKTKHKKFTFGIPCILLVQILLLVFIYMMYKDIL